MKTERLSEKARQIIEKAKKFDTHLTTETGAWRGAYSFWQYNTNLSELNECDKKQLSRYAMHSCFEQARYFDGGEKEVREQILDLSKKFGMTKFELQRWLRRYEGNNWERREISDWGYRGFYGIRKIASKFEVH